MERENRKALWLIIYVGDSAASNIINEEIFKLYGYNYESNTEENAFVWIGFIRSIILHFRLKKFGIVSMFDYIKLTDSVWC